MAKSTSLWGMDLVGVANLADEFDKQSGELGEIDKRVVALLASKAWVGGDRALFDQDWQNHGAKLISGCATALAGVASYLREQAEEQRKTSQSTGVQGPGSTWSDKATDDIEKNRARRAHQVAYPFQICSPDIEGRKNDPEFQFDSREDPPSNLSPGAAEKFREDQDAAIIVAQFIVGNYYTMSKAELAAQINSLTPAQVEILLERSNPVSGRSFAFEVAALGALIGVNSLTSAKAVVVDILTAEAPDSSSSKSANVNIAVAFVTAQGGALVSTQTSNDGSISKSLEISGGAGVKFPTIKGSPLSVEGGFVMTGQTVMHFPDAGSAAKFDKLFTEKYAQAGSGNSNVSASDLMNISENAEAAAKASNASVEKLFSTEYMIKGKLDFGAAEGEAALRIKYEDNQTTNKTSSTFALDLGAEYGGKTGGGIPISGSGSFNGEFTVVRGRDGTVEQILMTSDAAGAFNSKVGKLPEPASAYAGALNGVDPLAAGGGEKLNADVSVKHGGENQLLLLRTPENAAKLDAIGKGLDTGDIGAIWSGSAAMASEAYQIYQPYLEVSVSKDVGVDTGPVKVEFKEELAYRDNFSPKVNLPTPQ